MSIEINKVAPQNAVKWVKRAWVLFQEQSWLWMQSFVFIVTALIMLSILGPLGSLVFFVIYPFLLSGVFHMALNANNGVTSQFKNLFIAFSDQRVRRVFLQLGGLSFVINVLASPLSMAIFTGVLESKPVESYLMWSYLAINLTHYLFFFFAIPIAYFFHEQNLFTIIKAVFQAILSNIGPLAVLMMILLGLFFISMLTFLMALVIVAPLMMIVNYLAFNDIMCPPLPDSDTEPKESDVTFIV